MTGDELTSFRCAMLPSQKTYMRSTGLCSLARQLSKHAMPNALWFLRWGVCRCERKFYGRLRIRIFPKNGHIVTSHAITLPLIGITCAFCRYYVTFDFAGKNEVTLFFTIVLLLVGVTFKFRRYYVTFHFAAQSEVTLFFTILLLLVEIICPFRCYYVTCRLNKRQKMMSVGEWRALMWLLYLAGSLSVHCKFFCSAPISNS